MLRQLAAAIALSTAAWLGCSAGPDEATYRGGSDEAPALPPGEGDVRPGRPVAPPTPIENDLPDPVESGPADKIVLDASWQAQETGYWCGPASTRIALTTAMGSPPSQGTLADYLGTTVNGTDHIGLVAGALNHYLETSWFASKDMYDPPTQEQRDTLKADLVLDLSKGYPLVANVVSGWRPPGYPSGTIFHYVAIIGYADKGESVLIADPAGEGGGGSSWSNVPSTYWISVWDLGTWIGGKGYAG